jgi:ubiquinone/menaquinone biosynthesis C-methylase UbiE
MGSMLDRANRAAVAAAVDALAPAPGQIVADIGFGGGLGLALLLDRVSPAGRVHGVDISRVMLDRVRRRHRHAVADERLVLHEASMTDLPLADASVDAAITINTIYFAPDNVFAELARTLSPTGRLVLGLGDPDAMARDPVTAHAFRLRPMTDVQVALTAAGLTLADHRRVGDGPNAFHLLVALPTTGPTTRPPN